MAGSTSHPHQPAHAVTMNRVYRRQRHIYDLTRKYYLFGRDTMLKAMDVPEGGRVLEVGCGTGRNLVQAAEATPHALFYGFDISTAMLESAHAKASASPAAERIFLAAGDAENFNASRHFAVAGFDRIFFSYTISMIPGWQQALRHAVGQLKPGGSIHLVDFSTMQAWPGFARKAMSAWLARFHVEPRAGIADVLTGIAAEAGLDADIQQLGGGYAVLARIGGQPQAAFSQHYARQEGGPDRVRHVMQT